MDTSVATITTSSNSAKPTRRRRRPRQGPSNPDTNPDAATGPSTGGGQYRRTHNRPKREGKDEGDGKEGVRGGRRKDGGGEGRSNEMSGVSGDAARDGKSGQSKQTTRKPKPPLSNAISGEDHVEAVTDQGQLAQPSGDPKRKRRAPKFNGVLTDVTQQTTSETREDVSSSARYRHLPKKDDLTSRLIRELSAPPYQDCLICFAPIHPAQPSWSCSPLMPISAATDDEGEKGTPKAAETAQCCWTTFHLKCIRSWAAKSVKGVEDAWRARGEERKGEWRCPGCQSKRAVVPASYWCVYAHVCA